MDPAGTPAGREEMERILPSDELWDVIRRPGPDGKTHIWCIPPELHLGALYYRKDVLRNAGLDPERPPETWDEFFDMCLQTCDPREGIYGCYFQPSWALTACIRSDPCEHDIGHRAQVLPLPGGSPLVPGTEEPHRQRGLRLRRCGLGLPQPGPGGGQTRLGCRHIVLEL